MRRFVAIISILLLLTLPVSAFSGISSAENQSAVSSDGSCQVTLTVQLQLESVPQTLVYPVPGNASGITVNGTSVSGVYGGSVRNIDLSGFVSGPGSYTMIIRYTLKGCVADGKDGSLLLTLELLSGFDYPVDALSFSVVLPGAVEARPSFSSTYYSDSIELMMTVAQEGNTISGQLSQRLQDHEKLTMTLAVSEEMFPQERKSGPSMDTPDAIMLVFFGLAVLYWLIALRCLPVGRQRRTLPPDGITAGEVGCRLTGQGADLTLMVVSWAQMGYLLIQPDDSGRVLLHKRMDMGNERDDFENKVFRKLFGRRSMVDGTGYHYAQLCRKVGRSVPGRRGQFLPGSGNPMLFRVLMAAVGTFNGLSLAAAFTDDSGWRAVLSILLGVAGTAAAWLMQGAARSANSRRRLDALVGIAAGIIWLVIARFTNKWGISLAVIAAEYLAGFAALYGGRRSESGKMDAAQILGLRHYLTHAGSEELQRLLRANPQYFYEMAPYALALGVDRKFARQLKNVRLPECPYLTTGMDGHLTAPEWNQLLRETVAALDAMQQRLPVDKLLGR